MSDPRQRKPPSTKLVADPSPRQAESEKSKNKKPAEDRPDLELNIFVVAGLFLAFSIFLGSILYYKVDHRNRGPFAGWVNENFPIVNTALNRPSRPILGAYAADAPAGGLQLTEEELKAYTGEDPSAPIYLGINGTIFDVSASPAFYGPGGHYNHFVGKDATRAWITECWDDPEQFTWRLDDVEVMFMPKWLDEMLEAVGRGETEDMGDIGAMPQDMLGTMAKKAMERFGTVTDKQKKQRRKADKQEADAKVHETLAHWVNFFSSNPKYTIVGSVIRDESRPAPPKPCEAAMKKRPMKGGKLESLMGAMAPMMGGQAAGEAGGASAGTGMGEMPAAVKEQIEKAKAAAAAAGGAAKEKAEDIKEKVEEVVTGSGQEKDETFLHEEL